MSTHVISVLVENHAGALSRIAGLFSSRGYNISSLTVAETDDPSASRMTIVVAGDESILEQVVKQLNRLVDVIKVYDFSSQPMVDRELMFVRVDATKANRHEIFSLATMFGAKVAAVSAASITLELTSEGQTLNAFASLLKPYGVKELVRSGTVAIAARR